MIEIELRWALALYSSVLGVMAVCIWLYTELTVRRPQRYLGQQYLWRCTFCGFSYLDDEDELFSKCPRCESINSAGDRHVRLVPTKPRSVPASPGEGAQAEAADPPRRNPSRRKRPHQRRRGPRKR